MAAKKPGTEEPIGTHADEQLTDQSTQPGDYAVRDAEVGPGEFTVSLARRRELTEIAFSVVERIEALPPQEREFVSTTVGNLLAGAEMSYDVD